MEPCKHCGARGSYELRCDKCSLTCTYCAGCVSPRVAESLAELHAAKCKGRVTLSGPDVNVTIGAAAAASR